MRKRMAIVTLAASLLAAMPVSPAQAQSCSCICLVPDNPGCLIKCLVNWTAYAATHGGTGPGYTCADVS